MSTIPGKFRPIALTNNPLENSLMELQETAARAAQQSADPRGAKPRPLWRQPEPSVWFTNHGEYSTLAQCSAERLDAWSPAVKWDSSHHLVYSRINDVIPNNMRSYFDRPIASAGLRTHTLAFPRAHRAAECEKRVSLPIPYRFQLEPTSPTQFARIAGLQKREKPVQRSRSAPSVGLGPDARAKEEVSQALSGKGKIPPLPDIPGAEWYMYGGPDHSVSRAGLKITGRQFAFLDSGEKVSWRDVFPVVAKELASEPGAAVAQEFWKLGDGRGWIRADPHFEWLYGPLEKGLAEELAAKFDIRAKAPGAPPWSDTHHLVQSRLNSTSPVNTRSYFDRMLDVPSVGAFSLERREYPVTWDLSDPTLTPQERHRNRVRAAWKCGFPAEKNHLERPVDKGPLFGEWNP